MAIPKKNFFDLEQALQHLKLLGYSESDPVYLRFFYSSSDPRKTGDRGRKLTVPSVSELHRYKRKIEKLQADGRGVYFVVNGGGHTDSEVSKANTTFAEDDKRPLGKFLTKPDNRGQNCRANVSFLYQKFGWAAVLTPKLSAYTLDLVYGCPVLSNFIGAQGRAEESLAGFETA